MSKTEKSREKVEKNQAQKSNSCGHMDICTKVYELLEDVSLLFD